jgi:tungstate transport system permease protein
VKDLFDAAVAALHMMLTLDPALVEIVVLSLAVSLTAVGLAALLGLPLGAAVALFRFPGRGALALALNTMMGLPPVVVGLVVYLALSRSGPLGVLGLLFTPTAMIVAQCVLVLPIVAALARQAVADLWEEYRDQLVSLAAGRMRIVATLLWDGRVRLTTAVLAGFGRASAEVGAVMIVGGNIDHVTRMMTTSIALETSKGDLVKAIALGYVLIALSLAVNAAASVLSASTRPAQVAP